MVLKKIVFRSWSYFSDLFDEIKSNFTLSFTLEIRLVAHFFFLSTCSCLFRSPSVISMPLASLDYFDPLLALVKVPCVRLCS